MEKDRKFCVYLHLRKDTNNVFYVGKGLNSRPSDKNNRNRYWKNIVNKHGYLIDIVTDNLTENEAFSLEIELISKYSKEFKLANMTSGGEGPSGFKHTKKSKDKFSGKNHPMYGKSSEDHPMYGKKHSSKSRKMMSESHKGQVPHNRGKPTSEDIKANLSRGQQRRRLKMKEDEILNVQKERGEVYGTFRDHSEAVSSIIDILNQVNTQKNKKKTRFTKIFEITLFYVVSKLVRLATTPDHLDSALDLGSYAKLYYDDLKQQKGSSNEAINKKS